MGRLLTDRSKPNGVAWYRFARTRFHCPLCHVELHPITRPIGYFLQALIFAVGAFGLFLWFSETVGRSPWLLALGVGSAISLMLMLGILCAKWGFGYSIALDKSGRNDASDH